MVSQLSYLPQCSIRSMSCMLFSISLCVVLHVWMLGHILDFVDNMSSISSSATIVRLQYKQKNTKYILTWNHRLIEGESSKNTFSSLNCPVSNCFLTKDKNLFLNYTKFDAIVYNNWILNSEERPTERIPSQIYVFTTVESSFTEPACELYNDNFFNWTFTFRLDSDVLRPFFVVRNASSGAVVAPSATVAWKENQNPPRSEIKSILRKKRKAAAWLVSHCDARSFRDDYLTRLQQHLSHFGLKIDVYGNCSKIKCKKSCDETLKKNYRFYMAFENSFADDYVTEKVMHGYRNYAVPVVYGGANYRRFLPPGSYINAGGMHPYVLASLIYEANRNPSVFESYFRWTNMYSIEQWGRGGHPLCNLCAALNDQRAKRAPAKKNFRLWWNTRSGMKWCLPKAYWNETSQVTLHSQSIFNEY